MKKQNVSFSKLAWHFFPLSFPNTSKEEREKDSLFSRNTEAQEAEMGTANSDCVALPEKNN